MNPETVKSTVQVAARHKFARLSMSREERGVIASSTEQNKQFDPGGGWRNHYFSEGICPLFCSLSCAFCFLSAFFLWFIIPCSRGKNSFPSRMEMIEVREPDG